MTVVPVVAVQEHQKMVQQKTTLEVREILRLPLPHKVPVVVLVDVRNLITLLPVVAVVERVQVVQMEWSITMVTAQEATEVPVQPIVIELVPQYIMRQAVAAVLLAMGLLPVEPEALVSGGMVAEILLLLRLRS